MTIDRRSFLRSSLATLALAPLARSAGAAALREFTITAGPSTLQVGTSAWSTWAYDGGAPGPDIRVVRGDRVRIRLRNELPDPTTIHWHGLAVPLAMDGVVGLSQPAVQPGDSFTYEFDATQSGTFFYHAHVGLQLDRGLYGAFIVEEPGENEQLRVDREYVLLLDDWLTTTPEEALAALLRAPGGMGMGMGGAMSTPAYAGYLLNGTTTPARLGVTRGQRIRLRFINAASATPFRVGIAGHRLSVTHADGQPVVPVDVSTFEIGMGERYDVVVQADNPGAWAVLAAPSGSSVPATLGRLVYEGYDRPVAAVPAWPVDLLSGRALRYTDLRSTTPNRAATSPLVIPAMLYATGAGSSMAWTINGQVYPDAEPFVVHEGRAVQIVMTNRSMMAHPMHLHGHTGVLRVRGGSSDGFAKDTVLLNPMESATLEFTADNPGRWLFHCHNLYHMEMGMARVVEYR